MNYCYKIILTSLLSLLLFFISSDTVLAQNLISVSNTIVGEPFTTTAIFHGLSNLKDKNGQIVPQNYQVSYAQLSIWNSASGRDLDSSKVSYEAYLNGNLVPGHTGLYRNWYPDSPFIYNTNDTLVIKANNRRVTVTGQYNASAFLEVTLQGPHPMTFDLGIPDTTPDGKSFIYVFNFTNQKISTLTPTVTSIPTNTPTPTVNNTPAAITLKPTTAPNTSPSPFNPRILINYVVSFIKHLLS